jgi:uncharacterized protein (TIGR00290 family)
MRERVLLSWSGGKDGALALHALRRSAHFEPAGLLTTIVEEEERVSVHGVRRELLRLQAAAVGLPLHEVAVPAGASNAEYEERLAAALRPVRERRIRRVAFGDLFLEDVRAYRERQLAALGMEALFPVWTRDTAGLARQFLLLGFAAVLVCVDGELLDPDCAGQSYDAALLAELPLDVDPCGENGEFHTFVHAGPVLRAPVRFTPGALKARGRFVYRDLLPG